MDGIKRRDFLNGAAIAIAGFSLGGGRAVAGVPVLNGPYPPRKTGLRGSHNGAFEAAHAVRDGKTYDLNSVPIAETYDLVIVGGGISGLSAAYFHRARRPNDKILILDNHDDFGGHAKRNEFDVDGRKLIGYGGTQSIDSPRGRYSEVSMGLLKGLGIEVERFNTAFDQEFYYKAKTGAATFFKKGVFGADVLIPADIRPGPAVDPDEPDPPGMDIEVKRKRIDLYPMSPAARAKIFEIETSDRDPLPGKTAAEQKAVTDHISYADFLRRYWDASEEVLTLYQQKPQGLWGVGIDAVSATTCLRSGYPGGKGLQRLRRGGGGGHDEAYIYHFPDGNASIARMLVRDLVPGAAPGKTMEDIVLAPFDYSALDRPGNTVRIRLNSTAVRVRNVGEGVEVGYVRGGKLVRVKARAAVLACYNMMIPYIMEGVPEAQAEALHMNVKAPLVYINVAMRNWRAWAKLGVNAVSNPGGMFPSMSLDFPVSLGAYHFARTPDDPIVAHLLFVPTEPNVGLGMREQYRAGRTKLYTMTFGDFETNIRDEMTRILGPGGFVFDRDVAGITVNRWAHGYAYTPESLTDDPAVQKVRAEVARQPIGRVTIANSDAGWDAYTDVAIDEAHRAITEIAAMA
ncbi:MAG: NAD(P)-binding protein [Pseudomonadota bacterium]|uniref:NAD(P)-binding protein n=1 Tax=Phenylobacterium sp. TaxID=1871053 RepID=UPI0025DB2E1E|nr:NAD(P)/FAD-dependent oxidoreductase [Phenylobacterium sp.]